MKKITSLAPILVVIAAGIGIRIYFALVFGFDWDASILIYQAQLASQGATMFSQIRVEAPMYVYLLTLMLPIFGTQIWIVKILSGISSLVIALFVYLIGEELFGKKAGLLSLSLYLLIPVVAIFDVQGTYRTVFQVPVIASFYLVITGTRSSRRILLISGGLLSGISVWLYAGSAFYGLLLITAPLVYGVIPFARRTRASLNVLGGLALGFGLGIITFMLLGSSFSLLESAWLPSITAFAGGTSGGGRFANFGSFIDYLAYLARYVYIATRDWIPVISLGLLYLVTLVVSTVRKASPRKKALSILVLFLALFFYFLSVIIGINLPPHGNFGLFDTPFYFVVILGAEILILVPLMFAFSMRFSIQLDSHHKVAMLWIAWLLILLASFQVPHAFYFQFFAAPLCVLGGYVIQMVFTRGSYGIGNRNSLIAIILVIFVAVSGVLGGVMFVNSNINEWSLSGQQISSVGSYLRTHTAPTDYVFTAAPVYALAADRANAGNMDNYFYFVNSGTTSINYSLTVSQIYTLMQGGKVKYIILDPVGRTQAFLAHYPDIQMFFQDNYQKVITIDGASIWLFLPRTTK